MACGVPSRRIPVRRLRPLVQPGVVIVADGTELPDGVPEIPKRGGHPDAIPVDERHSAPVPEDGVAGRDVAVAHDGSLGDLLGTLLEAGPGREARDTLVVRPQQLANRRHRTLIEHPSLGVGGHPPVDPGEHDCAVGFGAHQAGSTVETGPLQMHEQLPCRLGAGGGRAPHCVAEPDKLGHTPSDRLPVAGALLVARHASSVTTAGAGPSVALFGCRRAARELTVSLHQLLSGPGASLPESAGACDVHLASPRLLDSAKQPPEALRRRLFVDESGHQACTLRQIEASQRSIRNSVVSLASRPASPATHWDRSPLGYWSDRSPISPSGSASSRSPTSSMARAMAEASSSNGREPTSRARRVIALARGRERVTVDQAGSCPVSCRESNGGLGAHRDLPPEIYADLPENHGKT